VPGGQPKTPAVVFLALPAFPPPALDGEYADGPVDNSARERRYPVETAVCALGAVPERGTNKPPQRVAAQTDRHEREQQLPERLVRDRMQGTLLIRQLASLPKCQLQSEDPDDCVDQRASD
jgi:hypothetical protein